MIEEMLLGLWFAFELGAHVLFMRYAERRRRKLCINH